MLPFSSIRHFQEQLNGGHTTCVAAVQLFLSRIEARKDLNAFIEVFADEALQRAAMLDEASVRGPLHGVVVGIKDNILYQGHPSSAASGILQGFRSVYSATVVERLLEAGAIIIGRQNCDEFGMGSTNENSIYGPVPNPHNPERVAGGSSGGSAAAVAAGLCLVSLGSDTGGSVRLPADFCGVVGYKPAYGRISRHGLIAYGSSFDQVGIIGQTVDDICQVMDIIAGPDAYDSTCAPAPSATMASNGPYRIAYFDDWVNHSSLDPEIRAALLGQIDRLRHQGHQVTALPFPFTDYIVPAYYVLTTAEASSNLSRYDGVRFGTVRAENDADLPAFYRANRTLGFGKEVRKRILLGSFVLSTGYFDAYYTKAQQVRQLLKEQTQLIFNDFDFILAPNSPSVAYPRKRAEADPIALYMGDIFTVFASLVGIPAISLPVFKHSSRIPFGLQLMAAPQNEVPLQRFSQRLLQQ